MKIKYFILLLCPVAFCYLFSCTKDNDQSITYNISSTGDTLYICDASLIKEHRKMELSDWIIDIKIVHLENEDTALCKPWKIYITDNYIGIMQEAAVFKLFDHQGKFLCDVGHIGQGPGEYVTLYGAAISEKLNEIYLASFVGTYLYKYDLKGNFISVIEMESDLNKPQMYFRGDGNLFLTHLCFVDMSSFQYANINREGKVDYILPIRHLALNPRNADGDFCGFNDEVFLYNNITYFTYMTMSRDTLYRVKSQLGETVPRFTLKNHATDRTYCTYNELSSCFLANVVSYADVPELSVSDNIVVDKQSRQSYNLELSNDYMGHLPVSNFPQASNGWYYEIFEPLELMELIEKHLSQNDCSAEDREQLEQLLNTFDEDSNNILFMGKLKSTKNNSL